MLFFRLQGGEVFYIQPFSTPQNDLFNQLLLLFSFISLIVLVYIAIDWSNDFLILTPTRVIFEDTELLVRQIQQEIVIENIQQVNVRADSYLAYLLGYFRNWTQRIMRRLGFRSKPVDTAAGRLRQDYRRVVQPADADFRVRGSSVRNAAQNPGRGQQAAQAAGCRHLAPPDRKSGV